MSRLKALSTLFFLVEISKMSRIARNLSLVFPTRSVTNQAVQPQKMARGLKFRIKEVEGLYYLCRENKGTDQLRATVKLICVFVLVYAKSRFSHDAAQIIIHSTIIV